MAQVHVDTEGVEKYLVGSEALIPGLQRVAVKVLGQAKRLCPVGTPESTGHPGYQGGRLRASLSFGILNEGGLPYARIGSGGDGETEQVEYAAYVEYGTYKMTPRPYLRPALTAVLGRVEGYYGDDAG